MQSYNIYLIRVDSPGGEALIRYMLWDCGFTVKKIYLIRATAKLEAA